MRGYRRYYTYLKIPDLAGTVGIEIPKYRGMRGYRRYDNLKIPDLAGTVRYDISQIPVPGTTLPSIPMSQVSSPAVQTGVSDSRATCGCA